MQGIDSVVQEYINAAMVQTEGLEAILPKPEPLARFKKQNAESLESRHSNQELSLDAGGLTSLEPLCIRINTAQYLIEELAELEKRIQHAWQMRVISDASSKGANEAGVEFATGKLQELFAGAAQVLRGVITQLCTYTANVVSCIREHKS